MKFINDFNLKKQAEELDIKVWQTPGFLFILMGIITVIIMTATYFISKIYAEPAVLVISESVVVAVILIIGTTIVRFVDQIVRLNKMKSEFISVASHQLRTPLSAMKWEIELFLSKNKKKLNKGQLSEVENMNALTKKMIHLVGDLLNVAKIDQHRLIVRKQGFNFMKLVQEIFEELSPLARARQIEISLQSKEKRLMAFTDPEKIKMVVENLISNAIKYTTSGGKIEIKLMKKNQNLIFEIKDNGVGIPEEQIDQVFSKFFRSDNAVRYQTEGTGLGLYIAKNIVEQSGGNIWFQSIENIGSLFSFSLPLSKKVNDK